MVEAAPNVRAALTARYAGNPKISVMTPEEAAAMPPGSFDLIVLHSVAQYLSGAELDGLLATFRTLLKPDGLLRSRRHRAAAVGGAGGGLALLRCGAANGFFFAAVLGLIRIVVSDYLRLKKNGRLSHYEDAAMLAKLTPRAMSANARRAISAIISSA